MSSLYRKNPKKLTSVVFASDPEGEVIVYSDKVRPSRAQALLARSLSFSNTPRALWALCPPPVR